MKRTLVRDIRKNQALKKQEKRTAQELKKALQFAKDNGISRSEAENITKEYYPVLDSKFDRHRY